MLVLGTHRSGTSVTTALVQAQGFALGAPLLHVGEENPLGHFEHERVLALHESFLHELGWEWFDAVDPLTAAGRERKRRWRSAIEACFEEIAAGADRFAVKDPRMVLFLPLWRSGLRRLGVPTRAIVTVRHPATTAHSLHHRNHLPLAEGEWIWWRDMAAIRRGIGRLPHGIVHYERLLEDPVGVMMAGFAGAGLQWAPEADDAVRSLVDPALNRSATRSDHSGGEHGLEGEVSMAVVRMHRRLESLSSVRQWPRIDVARPSDDIR